MSISYDSMTNTILIVGGSEASPYSFEDIYQADQNNGWGVIEKIGNKSYFVSAHVKFGDHVTDTYFYDEYANVEFDNSIISTENRVFMEDDAHCNISFKYCNFLFFGTLATWACCYIDHAVVESCSFINGYSYDVIVHVKVANYCLFKHTLPQVIENVSYITVHNGMFQGSSTLSFGGNVFIFENGTSARAFNSSVTFKNLHGYDCNYCFFSATTRDIVCERHLINCYFDTWRTRNYSGTGSTGYPIYYRKYEINFRVVDRDGNVLEGYKVQIFNKNGELVAEFISELDYTNVILLYAKLNMGEKFPDWVGSGTYQDAEEEDWDYYNPFTIKVWFGAEKVFEGILKDEDYVNNPPAYIDIIVNPSSFTLTDIMNEIQNHRNTVEPKIDVNISSRSSHTPADVWNYATRELTNPDDYKADVSDLAKELTVQSIKSQTDSIENNTNEIKQSLNNDVVIPLQRILGLSQENYILQPIEYNASGQLTKGRIKIYQNSTDCSNEENEIASYYIEVEYLGDGRLSKYKVIKE